MPTLSDLRASSLNARIFAIVFPFHSCQLPVVGCRCFESAHRARWGRVRMRCPTLLADDRQDILLAEDEQLVVLQLELGAAILGEEHRVPNRERHRDALALIRQATLADG